MFLLVYLIFFKNILLIVLYCFLIIMFKQQSSIKNLRKYSTIDIINKFVGKIVLFNLFCKIINKNKNKFSNIEAARNIIIFTNILNILLFNLFNNIYIIG